MERWHKSLSCMCQQSLQRFCWRTSSVQSNDQILLLYQDVGLPNVPCGRTSVPKMEGGGVEVSCSQKTRRLLVAVVAEVAEMARFQNGKKDGPLALFVVHYTVHQHPQSWHPCSSANLP